MKDNVRVDSLLADHSKLDRNSFWHFYLGAIEARRKNVLELMGKVTATNEEFRQWQGMNNAFKEIKTLSDRLVKELRGGENKKG